MMRQNAFITVVWTTAFVLFLVIVFLTLFVTIYMVSFEETVREQGYPSDFKDLAKWGYRDYLYWAIDWLPEKLLKKIKRKAVNDDDIAGDGAYHESDDGAEGVTAQDGKIAQTERFADAKENTRI